MPLTTKDTVLSETPACFATSRIPTTSASFQRLYINPTASDSTRGRPACSGHARESHESVTGNQSVSIAHTYAHTLYPGIRPSALYYQAHSDILKPYDRCCSAPKQAYGIFPHRPRYRAVSRETQWSKHRNRTYCVFISRLPDKYTKKSTTTA